MTKEEFAKKICNIIYENKYNSIKSKNKICKKCVYFKHYKNNKNGKCLNIDNYRMNKNYIIVNKKFSCNRFKSKEEK